MSFPQTGCSEASFQNRMVFDIFLYFAYVQKIKTKNLYGVINLFYCNIGNSAIKFLPSLALFHSFSRQQELL